MSNTSTVTPYSASTSSSESSGVGAGLAAACVIGAVVGVVSVARWLAQESEEDKEALTKLKKDRGRELLADSANGKIASEKSQDELQRITTVDLRMRNPESIVKTAEKLGYRLQSISQPSASLRTESPILLERASGERLAIARNSAGRLAVHTVGERRRIQDLVREHTVERAREHLTAKGMTVQSAQLPNGEVQILAREQAMSGRGGAAEIKAQVRVDGTALVDVDKVQGKRCEEIVQELAQAVGGEVSDMRMKSSYYQLPGEPTKTQVKV
jgi:hypothetical protein